MAKTREDFLLNPDGDFPLQDTIVGGVYLATPYGISEQQHIQDIIEYDKGALSQFPTLGFGVNNYLNSEFSLDLIEKNLNENMEKDGYACRNGSLAPQNGGGFSINTKFIDRK